MKLDDFFNGLQTYYGKYKPVIKLAILNFFDGKIFEKDLDELYEQILIDYSTKWHVPPDINIIMDSVKNTTFKAVIRCKYCGARVGENHSVSCEHKWDVHKGTYIKKSPSKRKEIEGLAYYNKKDIRLLEE